MISITDEEFTLITAFIKQHSGIQLKTDKQSLITGRLYTVLQELEIDNFTDYLHYVSTDRSGEALKTLINKITTNHTFFMREIKHFDFFRDRVLPFLTLNVKDKDLRIWSAGCSTGEEPYTLAMILNEYLGLNHSKWDSTILATDISHHVLQIAQKGLYEPEQVNQLPIAWQQKFFTKEQSNLLAITPTIKNDVLFRHFNLMEELYPFKRKFHVIFCRNVMIYFDSSTRDFLIQKFYDLLEPGGYLFIGHSESINREKSKFTYVMPAVYRKE